MILVWYYYRTQIRWAWGLDNICVEHVLYYVDQIFRVIRAEYGLRSHIYAYMGIHFCYGVSNTFGYYRHNMYIQCMVLTKHISYYVGRSWIIVRDHLYSPWISIIYGLTTSLYACKKTRGTYSIKWLQLYFRVPNIIKGVSRDLELIATNSQLPIWASVRISISRFLWGSILPVFGKLLTLLRVLSRR